MQGQYKDRDFIDHYLYDGVHFKSQEITNIINIMLKEADLPAFTRDNQGINMDHLTIPNGCWNCNKEHNRKHTKCRVDLTIPCRICGKHGHVPDTCMSRAKMCGICGRGHAQEKCWEHEKNQ